MPGIGCGYPENIGLGCLYILSGFCCISFLLKIYFINKKRKAKLDTIQKQVNIYWIFAMLWLFYRGILWIFPFNVSQKNFRLMYNGFNQILCLLPMAILILILCELLYKYYNVPEKSEIFFRIIFLVFLFVFLVIGICFSVLIDYPEDSSDVSSPLYLWSSATNIVTLVFVLVPAVYVIRSVTNPVIQPEDRKCVDWSRAGIVIFSVMSIFRCLYNALQHFGKNPITNWFNNELFGDGAHAVSIRVYSFIFYSIFDLGTIWLANLAVYTCYKLSLKLSEDPFYARSRSDPLSFRTTIN